MASKPLAPSPRFVPPPLTVSGLTMSDLMSGGQAAGPNGLIVRMLYAAAAAALTVSGYIHGQLYIDSYRYIHVVGVLFMIQAAASFALSLLLLVGVFIRSSVLVPLGAAGAAAGALAGFVASRTVGVFGFTEHGWEPAPQSLLSVLMEIAVLVLLSAAAVVRLRSIAVQTRPLGA